MHYVVLLLVSSHTVYQICDMNSPMVPNILSHTLSAVLSAIHDDTITTPQHVGVKQIPQFKMSS